MEPTWTSDCGTVKLWLGDCLDVMASWPDGAVEAVVTDPPYGIPHKFGTSDLYGKRRMQFPFDSAESCELACAAMLIALSNCQNAFHVFCGCEQFGPLAKVARQCGFTTKPFARIKKCPPPPMPGNWWPSGFELAMYGYRPGAWFGDSSAKRVNTFTCDGYRHGIRAHEKTSHPTQKWLPMVEYIVQSISRGGTVVADPFMGSGTTGVAAVRLGRKFLGVEIDPEYFAIAKRRIQDELRRVAFLEGRASGPRQTMLSLEASCDAQS